MNSKLEALLKVQGEIKDSIDRVALKSIRKKAMEKDYDVENDFNLDETVALSMLREKYAYLVPVKFPFDPEKKIPEVFANKKAFIIWTGWRKGYLLGTHQDLRTASLKAAELAEKYHPTPYRNPTYTEEQKRNIIQEFEIHLNQGFYKEDKELKNWDKLIFPFLEGKYFFRWEKIKEKSNKNN